MADVGDAVLALAQQEHRPLDPPTLQVAVRGLAESGPEGTAEVRRGHVRDPGQRGHVQRLRVVAIHGVPGAQQATVALLNGSTHPCITS